MKKCPHCGGKGKYIGEQQLPPSLAEKVGKPTAGLYNCESCDSSFVDPGDAAKMVKE